MRHNAYIPFVTLQGQRCVPPHLRELQVGMSLQPVRVYTDASNARAAAIQDAGALRNRYQTCVTGVAQIFVEYNTTPRGCTVLGWIIDHEEWPLADELGWVADCQAVKTENDVPSYLISLWRVEREGDKLVPRSPKVEHWVTDEDDIRQFCINGRPSVYSLFKALREEDANVP